MPTNIGESIRELQKKGWSSRAISSHLHISTNTANIYLDKTKFSKRNLSYIKNMQRKRDQISNLDEVSVGNIDENTAKIYAALLYWCEGAKYPSTNKMDFTNSDFRVHKLFLALFRKGFKPDEPKFRIWLQIHSDQDKTKIFRYWSTLLRIPTAQFIKPHVTERRGGKYRSVYYGTCSVRYNDYKMVLRLMGIYRKFYSQTLKLII